ncbi:MAG: 2,3-diphosphoglycerate-dependent phosphoglycerate mutase [Candidatus Diapherotrites archaeon]|nr:2,3-diphosphoglycerate-dependent phosphoglycerate mutase [Candidatus Diapherotrites archaeon]
MFKIVLLRHGESIWNKENKFTGWVDVDLSEKGVEEAKKAGIVLKKEGFFFDIAFTSVLKRATHTLEIVLKEMNLNGKIPVNYSWRLNERHYGALQGLNKSEMAAKYGEEQVQIWRRSYDIRPPELKRTDKMFPGNDLLYKDVPKNELPLGECLKDNVVRTLPYWEKEIVPIIKSGKKVLIAAHGNSLRALVKHLDKVPDKEIVKFNIPTGIPLVYELDSNLNPIKHYYIGDPEEIAKAIEKIKNQGKAKN